MSYGLPVPNQTLCMIKKTFRLVTWLRLIVKKGRTCTQTCSLVVPRKGGTSVRYSVGGNLTTFPRCLVGPLLGYPISPSFKGTEASPGPHEAGVIRTPSYRKRKGSGFSDPDRRRRFRTLSTQDNSSFSSLTDISISLFWTSGGPPVSVSLPRLPEPEVQVLVNETVREWI